MNLRTLRSRELAALGDAIGAIREAAEGAKLEGFADRCFKLVGRVFAPAFCSLDDFDPTTGRAANHNNAADPPPSWLGRLNELVPPRASAFPLMPPGAAPPCGCTTSSPVASFARGFTLRSVAGVARRASPLAGQASGGVRPWALNQSRRKARSPRSFSRLARSFIRQRSSGLANGMVTPSSSRTVTLCAASA